MRSIVLRPFRSRLAMLAGVLVLMGSIGLLLAKGRPDLDRDESELVALSSRWVSAVADRNPGFVDLLSASAAEHYQHLRDVALHGEVPVLDALEPTDQLQVLFLRLAIDANQLHEMSGREILVRAIDEQWIGQGSAAHGRASRGGRRRRHGDRATLQVWPGRSPGPRTGSTSVARMESGASIFAASASDFGWTSNPSWRGPAWRPPKRPSSSSRRGSLRKVTPADFVPPASGPGTEISDVSVSKAQAGGDFLRLVAIRESPDDPHESAVTIEDRQESLRSVLFVGDFFGDENGHRLVRVAGDRAWLEHDGASLVLRLEPEGPPLDQRLRVDGAPAATVSLLKQARLGQYREGLMAQWRNVGLRARPQLLQQGWLVPEFAPGHETMLGLAFGSSSRGVSGTNSGWPRATCSSG